MLVTVAGLEMYQKYRNPNGIECDECGKRENWPREEWDENRDRLKDAGWKISDMECLCPICGKG